jgi:hypothetical protein
LCSCLQVRPYCPDWLSLNLNDPDDGTVDLLVLFPLRLRIPALQMGVYRTETVSFAIGLGLAPPLAVLLLLMTHVIDGETLRKGIIGADGIEPLTH